MNATTLIHASGTISPRNIAATRARVTPRHRTVSARGLAPGLVVRPTMMLMMRVDRTTTVAVPVSRAPPSGPIITVHRTTPTARLTNNVSTRLSLRPSWRARIRSSRIPVSVPRA